MAIGNYTALTNAVVGWLDVATADVSARLSDLVLTAEHRIMREVRTPEMESALSDNITTGGLLPVPTGYIEMKYAYVDGTPTQYLQLVSPSYIYENYPLRSGEGKPVVMARDGSNFIFGPYPSSDYTIKGRYYTHLTGIETNTLYTNALLSANPDLYLWATLAESEPLIMRDSRIQLWESKYTLIKERVNGEASRSHYSGNMSIRLG